MVQHLLTSSKPSKLLGIAKGRGGKRNCVLTVGCGLYKYLDFSSALDPGLKRELEGRNAGERDLEGERNGRFE